MCIHVYKSELNKFSSLYTVIKESSPLSIKWCSNIAVDHMKYVLQNQYNISIYSLKIMIN